MEILSQQGFVTVMERVTALNLLTVYRQWLLIVCCRSLALLAGSSLQNAGCFVVLYLRTTVWQLFHALVKTYFQLLRNEDLVLIGVFFVCLSLFGV